MNSYLESSIEILCQQADNQFEEHRGTVQGSIALVARAIGLLAFAVAEVYIPENINGDEAYSAASSIGEQIASAIIEHARETR